MCLKRSRHDEARFTHAKPFVTALPDWLKGFKDPDRISSVRELTGRQSQDHRKKPGAHYKDCRKT